MGRHLLYHLVLLMLTVTAETAELYDFTIPGSPGENIFGNYSCQGNITDVKHDWDYQDLTDDWDFLNVTHFTNGSSAVTLKNEIPLDIFLKNETCNTVKDNDNLFIPVHITCNGAIVDYIFHPQLDVENLPPTNLFICNTSASCEQMDHKQVWIPENFALSTPLFEYSICNKTPQSSRTVAILKNFTNIFDIMTSAGNADQAIILKSSLDYETTQTYTFSIYPTDTSSLFLKLTVHVTDVDDQGVQFNQSSYNCNIHENAKGETSCQVFAYDLDTVVNSPITYSIVDVTPPAYSSNIMIAKSGHIGLKQALDRETVSSIVVRVKGCQENMTHNLYKCNQTTVDIAVIDEDDNAPIMTSPQYVISVLESFPPGSIIGQVAATDKDLGDNAKFSFKTDDMPELFTLNNTSGSLTLNTEASLDREALHVSSYITFKVYAVSNVNSSLESNRSVINITVVDVNDNTPEFHVSTSDVTILKTLTVRQAVLNFTVTDSDVGDNGRVNVTIVTQDVPFIIRSKGPDGFSLILNANLSDYFEPIYKLLLIAQDMPTDRLQTRSSYKEVTIHVKDVNIHEPDFVAFPTQHIHIQENLPPGVIVLEFRASDKDPDDQLTFAMTGNADVIKAFVLNKTLLVTKMALDKETTAAYSVSISVSDGNHTVQKVLTIIVDDVNDNSPQFDSTYYRFNVPENAINLTIGVVSANDADIGANREVEYFLEAESIWSNNFTINNRTGELRSIGGLDRESDSLTEDGSLSFSVFVRDKGSSPRISTAIVQIDVADVNDNKPTFLQHDVSLVVLELSNNTDIYTAKAIDGDSNDNAVIKYKLLSNGGSKVTMDEDTGRVRWIKTPVVIEDCNTTIIEIDIEAYNIVPGTTNDTLHLNIQIQDVNDHAPVFRADLSLGPLIEHRRSPGKPLCYNQDLTSKTLLHHPHCTAAPPASDRDCDGSFNTLRYWMNTNDSRFLINGTTGVLSPVVGMELDYDPPTNDRQINFTIFASDGLHIANKTVSMDIVNEPRDGVPVVIPVEQDCYIDENFTGITNCSIYAFVPDKTMSLSTNRSIFGFNVTSSQSRLNASLNVSTGLDYDRDLTNRISILHVVIKTIPPPTLSATATITIHLVNINDEFPVFDKEVYNFTIPETTEVGTMIGVVNAADIDNLDTLVYSVIDPSIGINITKAGALYSTKEFDIDKGSKTTLVTTVAAFDGSHTVTTDVTVQLTPDNEFNPTFISNCRWNVTENQLFQTSVQASDGDVGEDGHITYSIITDLRITNITIDAESGNISMLLDRETMPVSGHIVITLVATDHGTPPRTGLTNCSINVQGVNDNLPYFLQKNVTLFIMEGHVEKDVFRSVAFDNDIGSDDAAILYHLKDPTVQGISLDETSGVLRVNGDFYIDSTNNGRMMIEIIARNKNSYTGNDAWPVQTVHIILRDINNYKPEFIGSDFSISITENTTVGSSIFGVHAKDNDTTSDFNTVMYFIEDITIPFHIDISDGIIYLVNKIDFDPPKNSRQFTFVVSATDGMENHTVSEIVVVNITDCNDNPPVFTQESYNCELQENKNGTFQCKVEATDIDEVSKDTITYTIQPSSNFEIHGDGSIYALGGYDFDTLTDTTIDLVVTANDGEFYVNATVTIHIIDVNDEPPTFDNDTYTFYIDENNVENAYVGHIAVTDEDSDFKLSIYCPKSKDYFRISPYGELFAVKTSDYEDPQERDFNCSLIASDVKHNITSEVIVHVNDLNDNTPRFSHSVYKAVLNETVKPGSRVIDVSATDDDMTLSYHRLTYSILDGNMNGEFSINSTTGSITTNSSFAKRGHLEFSLVVKAEDGGNPSNWNITVVEIEVVDINDCAPVFSANYSVEVEDITAPGIDILIVSASDCDADPNNRNITYSLHGEHNDAFSLKGNILEVKNLTKYNVQEYQLWVTASDGKFETNATIFIIIIDTNDHSPTFEQPELTFDTVETNLTDVYVGAVKAIDDDLGDNGAIKYNITAGNIDGQFYVEHENGSLFTTKSIDREKLPMYTLIITATDGAKNYRMGTCTVIVNVQDVNDNYPEFIRPDNYFATVKEDTAVGNIVNLNALPDATDKDNGVNGTQGVIYQLDDTTYFTIDSKSGVVTLKKGMDFETKDSYNLTVLAIDTDGIETYVLSSSASIIITVQDVNDCPPRFTDTRYSFTIEENIDMMTLVGDVTVLDDDLNTTNTFRYKIVDGGDDKFFIDSKGDIGVLYIAGFIDREIKKFYSLNITVNDGKFTAATTVDITVDDVNDHTPKFSFNTEDTFILSVAENWGPGVIYRFNATDGDEKESNNTQLVYSITNDHFNFTIDPENGTLYLNERLDREKRSKYILDVVVTDQGIPPLSATIQVIVDVTDVNDNAPEFAEPETTAYIIEKSPLESVIALLTASDEDSGDNGRITYSIEQSAVSKYFKIDHDLGLITIGQQIVINNLVEDGILETNETDEFSLNVTITATDNGQPDHLSSSILLHVHLESINDNAPVFDSSLYKFDNITENQAEGTVVGRCFARVHNVTTDHLRYTFVGSPESFVIDPHMGDIKTKKKLDRELTDHYTLAVRVTDGRVPERTAYTAVEVKVDDANDNVPIFYNDNITLKIFEAQNLTYSVNASAFDLDKGINALLNYTIVSDNTEDLFTIDERGTLYITGDFDYESEHIYTATIQVEDNGIPNLNNTASFTLYVEDINDNKPVFNDSIREFNVSEDQESGLLFSVSANDIDSGWNGVVVYTIDDDGPFSINPFNGSVYLDEHIDFETTQEYNIIISAIDQGLPSRHADKRVTIYVSDVYDDIPRFLHALFEVEINATAPIGTTVAELDAGVPAIFTLIGGDADVFTIDASSGRLATLQELDHDAKRYFVIVRATDQLNQTADCQVTILIQGHAVMFPQDEYTVYIAENINSEGFLIDVNTTEELNGDSVVYAISNITPEAPGLFDISPLDGKVYCYPGVDREIHGQYILHIVATAGTNRARRSVSNSGFSTMIKLIVNIDDVNDNPPEFDVSQPIKFTVPRDTRANFAVGSVKASDPDLVDAGKVRYSIIGGDSEVFEIDEITGEIRTRVVVASRKQDSFTLTIQAVDGPTENDTATLVIEIQVLPVSNSVILTIPLTIGDFRKRQEILLSNISAILDIGVEFLRVLPHTSMGDGGMPVVDPLKSDLFINGIYTTSSDIIDKVLMVELIRNATESLSALFGGSVEVVTHSTRTVRSYDPSAINVSQIAFVVLAVMIFLGSSIALIVAQYSWTRYDDVVEYEKFLKHHRTLKAEDLELSTIRSRQSSKLSSLTELRTNGAINPICTETEFIRRSDHTIVEERKLELNELTSDSSVNPDHGARSVVDSGVGNTSVHSEDNCLDGPGELQPDQNETLHRFSTENEGPMMTSSPRQSRDKQNPVIVIKTDGNDGDKSVDGEDDVDNAGEEKDADLNSTRGNDDDVVPEKIEHFGVDGGTELVLLDAIGETATDDELDDEEEEGHAYSKARKLSKRRSGDQRRGKKKGNMSDMILVLDITPKTGNGDEEHDGAEEDNTKEEHNVNDRSQGESQEAEVENGDDGPLNDEGTERTADVLIEKTDQFKLSVESTSL